MLNKKRSYPSKVKKNKSFLLKLFDILNEGEYHDIIHWNSNGNGIIITNEDKLSDSVLPNFYLHKNYASFKRQLHLYGFHKIRNMIKAGEKKEEKQEYTHDILNKNSPKEQINQIMRKNKKIRLMFKYKNKTDKNDIDFNDFNTQSYGKDIINYLLAKNNEGQQKLIESKKELENLRDINKTLKEQFFKIKAQFDGQSIIIKKIISNKVDKNIKNNKIKKGKNIKEFFKQYLYYLRIYSPYIYKDKDIQKNVLFK